jgi:hypothetical protein
MLEALAGQARTDGRTQTNETGAGSGGQRRGTRFQVGRQRKLSFSVASRFR